MTEHPSFIFVREEKVPEINAIAREYRHRKTSARILSMISDDTNKVFGITFRTPPENSTGIAHILEHSVLCGSRKYPVKEPFVELLKGSLQTFLNAMTYPDKTCYPVASENVKDFYNLANVYLDAVFYPRLTYEIFLQEGWHYQLPHENDRLTFKGVVFNEMKGVYSSPEDLLDEYSQRSLFPDTTYGVDSGGDPKHIPDLTYEQFTSFHKTFYHPSNAYIYFYGDDDPSLRLQLIEDYLKDFDFRSTDSAISNPAKFTEPKHHAYTYDPGEEAAQKAQSMFTTNWLLPDTTDLHANLNLSVLAYSLIGTPASPLRKALLDSGLGEDLAGAGFANHMKQMYFGTGLRGIREQDIPTAQHIITQTLETIARDGLDSDLLEAALNTLEFRMRESNTGGYPRGLAYMIAALNFWLYDADPLDPLRFEAPLARLRERLALNEPVFQELAKHCFSDNLHQTTVLLRPEPGLRKKEELEEEQRLDQARKSMSPEAVKTTIEQTLHLLELQETPDRPEDLSKIPSLRRNDIDAKIKRTPQQMVSLGGVTAYHHDLFTNGILYLDVGFNLQTIPPKMLQFVPLFGRAILEMNTHKEDFVSLSNRIGKTTGGIGVTPFVSSIHNRSDAAAWLFLRGKATRSKAPEMLDIFRDVLIDTDFGDRERFRQILLEEKAGYEAGIIPSGTSVADTRMRAGYSEAGWMNEQIKGVSQLFFLRELSESIDRDWDAVRSKFEQLRQALIHQSHCVVHGTVDDDSWNEIVPRLETFLEALPDTPPNPTSRPEPPSPYAEGLTIPAKVNYVVKGVNIFDHNYRLHGSIAAITNFLRAGYLWDRIRVQGGAYGASCSIDSRSGIFGFGSYRDPNLIETIEVYDQIPAFVRSVTLDEREITNSVIGAVGTLDAYQLPDARGFTALIQTLTGSTSEFRQQFRDELLGAEVSDFRRFADILEVVRDHGTVVVLGAQESIDSAASALGCSFRRTAVL